MNNTIFSNVSNVERTYETTLTGYTLSIVGTMNTGYYGNEIIPPIQGFPSINASILKEENRDVFPETREELFIDQKLQEFYNKKGYK